MGKLVERSALPSLAASLRDRGRSIVTFNGTFDVLHAGHVRCLAEAKQQGDVLIVPLNSDGSVRSYKGSGRPIVPEQDRAETLAAISHVDYVVLFDDINPIAILTEIRPDVHCNGADWGPGCIEREAVEKGGGRLHILGWAPGRSTSELLQRIRLLEESPHAVVLPASLLAPDAVRAAEAALEKIVSTSCEIVVIAEGEGDPSLAEGAISDSLARAGVPPASIHLVSPGTQDGAPSLLERVRDDLALALGSSWVVSDRMDHVVMGRLVNAKTVLVGAELEGPVLPHYQAATLAEALGFITG